ncbi:MAG: HAMP domain-containing histidine kinase [Campylobacteraceae bacterium]|nr:HAMP domain-containing histidine kinase [Campylobacteraceae bacterium]
MAGVAHEINTPLGIALTGITYFDSISLEIRNLYASNNISQDEFENYLNKTEDISEQIVANITRASNLVQAFKQISVDQTHEEKREFNVKEYTDGLILSIAAQIKKTKLSVNNNIPKDVKLYTYPGAYGQIITNLIMNSILHGYGDEKKGVITIDLKEASNHMELSYQDDGKGIEKKDLPYIFDAFFTTKKGTGGTGLGLNILYNIVQKQFNGQVSCNSEINQGVHFKITIPFV